MKNLTYKTIDIMKKTKDTVNSQLTSAQKDSLLAAIAQTGATHVAISIPMDIQATFIAAGTTPSPRTISAETQDWCDKIHNNGMKVLHRGTLLGAEAIWGAAYYDGSVATGTAASSSTDGATTLCGKYYQYLYTNVGIAHVQTGDVFAPIPEGTTHAFDGHYFWTAGSQANYADVFAKFHTITTTFGTASGTTLAFMSHNNFSELRSGWMPASLPTDQGYTGFDYYGRYQGSTSYSIANYVTDLNAVYAAYTHPMYQGEWGAIAGESLPAFPSHEGRMHYRIQFYKTYRDTYVDTSKMAGYSEWGGWEGQNTSILYLDSSSNFQLNSEGKILAAFFKNQTGMLRVPLITAGTTTDTYRF